MSYINPALAVDVVCMTSIDGVPHVALCHRAQAPEQGKLALPGVLLDEGQFPGETIQQAISRALQKVGIESETPYAVQIPFRDNPARDDRFRVIGLPHVTTRPAQDTEWFWYAIPELRGKELAFDHKAIIASACQKIVDSFTADTALFAGLMGGGITAPEVKSVLSYLNEDLPTDGVLRTIKKFYTETDKKSEPGASGGRPSRIYVP